MEPQWLLHPAAPGGLIERLAREAALHPLVAEILVRRGVETPEAAERFLRPSLEHLHDPFALLGMDAAVARIAQALERGERIVVSGDYDVDGVTSAALLIDFLGRAGAADPRSFIPNRFEHGYGLTPRTVEALLALQPDLVVTVDNGITAMDEVARLHAAGVDTVLTDHHLPREAGVPAGIVVNPVQPGCDYPFKGISGCGVTFKLLTALRKYLRERGWWTADRPEPNLRSYLDLVAIGTVADMVPLLDENRVLVHHGLRVLAGPAQRPGVAALLALTRGDEVTARTIAFQIGPRINAAGRMTEGQLGVELLLAEDARQAADLAGRLDQENSTRRQVGEEMFRAACAKVAAEGLADDPAIVVASPDFHEGIIGITASKLVETYHKPVVVLAENGRACKGSARSIGGIHVTRAIATAAHLLEQYGGHAGAAGCTVPKESVAEFRQRFVADCARQAAEAEPPALYLDGHLEPPRLDAALVEQLQCLEPFGHGNEEPAFLLSGQHLPRAPQVLKERHLKWHLAPGVEMVGWGLAGQVDAPEAADFRVRLGFNDFRGQRRIQLTVDGVRAAQ